MWIYILAFFLFLVIFIVAVIYHDTHTFVVKTYDLDTDKIDGDYSFALISDLHGYSFGKNNEKLKKEIEQINPDAILCAGDMFTGHFENGKVNTQVGLDLLSELAKKYPVYMGNGNHERKVKEYRSEFGNLFDRYRSHLVKAGVTVLENESVDIVGKNIRITGLDVHLSYYKRLKRQRMGVGYLERVLGKSSSGQYQVLIAHNPRYFGTYSKWGADLTVSGHVHGGIMRLPIVGGVISPTLTLFPKYDGGKFEENGRTMILSRGLGAHSIHIRVFNPCELDVIRLHGKH